MASSFSLSSSSFSAINFSLASANLAIFSTSFRKLPFSSSALSNFLLISTTSKAELLSFGSVQILSLILDPNTETLDITSTAGATRPIRAERLLLNGCSPHSLPLHQLLLNLNYTQTLQQSKNTMEKQEESSNPMHRVDLAPIGKKLPKLNRICPADAPQKKMEEENAPSVCVTPAIKVKSGSSYLSKQEGPATVGNVLHVRPVYSFGLALKGVEILGDSSPFQVKKVRSFPSNKYELFEKATAASYDLTSNFFGSQYHLKGQHATYLTIRFQVGCGSSQFRSCTIYALREESGWNQLQGNEDSQDLEQLYSKGNNYQRIAKYATLQPTINAKTGAYMLKFSRKFVVPCVENAIICNFNGQRLLQMAKINELDSHFQVTQWSKMGTVKVLAIVVASLDFKLCTQ